MCITKSRGGKNTSGHRYGMPATHWVWSRDYLINTLVLEYSPLRKQGWWTRGRLTSFNLMILRYINESRFIYMNNIPLFEQKREVMYSVLAKHFGVSYFPHCESFALWFWYAYRCVVVVWMVAYSRIHLCEKLLQFFKCNCTTLDFHQQYINTTGVLCLSLCLIASVLWSFLNWSLWWTLLISFYICIIYMTLTYCYKNLCTAYSANQDFLFSVISASPQLYLNHKKNCVCEPFVSDTVYHNSDK